MKRDEIIKGLHQIKNWNCNGDAKMYEVIANAIKLLEQLDTTSDTISRQTAINMLCSKCTVDKPETCSTIQKGDNWCQEVYILQRVPSAQPEPSIPLLWINDHIEWLKSLDNEFANLAATHISVMVKKWRGEQDE